MIYTVTVNPCLDVIKLLDVDYDPGALKSGTIRPANPNENEFMRPGGKGLDVSRALTCLGVETKALGFIGDQTGQIVRGMLKAEGIDNNFIETGIETRTNIILSLSRKKNGENLSQFQNNEIRVNSHGKEVPPNKYYLLYDLCHSINNADAFAICGSLSYGMQPAFYNSLIRDVRDASPQCVVMLDGPAEATAQAMQFEGTRPQFIKPNLKEFNELLEVLKDNDEIVIEKELYTSDIIPKDVSDEDFLEYMYTGVEPNSGGFQEKDKINDEKLSKNWEYLLNSIYSIKDKLGVSVLLSLGAMGCVCIDENGIIFHAYTNENIGKIETRVGAGDSVVAGFLAAFVQTQRDLPRSLKSGVAASIARITEDERETGSFLGKTTYFEFLEGDKILIDSYPAGDAHKLPKFRDSQQPSPISTNSTSREKAKRRKSSTRVQRTKT